MSVPSPSIAPTKAAGSTLHAVYAGPVVAVGETALNVNLTFLSKEIRSSQYFRAQLQVSFKALDNDISFVGPAVLTDANFFDGDDEPNEYVQIDVTSVSGEEECLVEVVLPHSIIR